MLRQFIRTHVTLVAIMIFIVIFTMVQMFKPLFLYNHDGKWKSPIGYCFVKPLKSKNIFTTDHERPAIGFLKYADKSLAKNNIQAGSLIGFTPGSEYEFIVEGQRLYRVPTNLITMKYECKGDEEEYKTSWA
jgi:hypothetical protein